MLRSQRDFIIQPRSFNGVRISSPSLVERRFTIARASLNKQSEEIRSRCVGGESPFRVEAANETRAEVEDEARQKD